MRASDVRRGGARYRVETKEATPLIDDVQMYPDVISGLSRQNSVYRRVIALCDEIADAALQGANAHELAQVCAGLLVKTVVLLDASFELRAYCSGGGGDVAAATWNPDDPSIRRLLGALAAENRPLRVPAVPDSVLPHGCLATPIAVGQQKLGYLLVLEDAAGGETDDTDLLVVSQAATLFALTLAKEQTTIDLGRRYQGAIVDALVSGHFLDREDASRKLTSLGLAEDQPFRVGVIRAQTEGTQGVGVFAASPEIQHLLGELAAAIPEAVPGAAVTVRGAEAVMVLPEETAEGGPGRARETEALRSLAATLADHSIGVKATCGISEPTRRAELAPRRMRQAEYAADIGIRIGRAGQLVRYDELGIYRLLLQIGDLRQLGQFADEVLGAVLRYDATHKTDLVRTLSVFLNQHASLKQAARQLGVHANTISYRLQRIEQLTPLNLANPDDRLAAHVAVKIIDSQRADGQPLGTPLRRV
ncbi:PucR family transcriptional regulator [Pseudonocardia hispaniensis]|uniref:PucR family transcriptional regulator n=1 Tax=Pseudonocardia hispaniensis TaxID=904933 RepID=A0ABW1J7T2_9PSEU